MTDLEIELHEVMVKLMVRFPDGQAKIQSAFDAVIEAGQEMRLEQWHDKVRVLK